MVDCRADLIEGMDAQLREGNAILGQYPRSERIFCIIGVPGTRELYGQANFVFDYGKPLKFCWNIEYLVSERYFEYVIEKGGVDRLVFADRPTYEWFVSKAQFASYASIATLATNPRETGRDFSPKGLRAIVSGLFRRGTPREQSPSDSAPDALSERARQMMGQYDDWHFIDIAKIGKMASLDAELERLMATARARGDDAELAALVRFFVSLSRFCPNVSSTPRLFCDLFAKRLPRGSDVIAAYNKASAQRRRIEQYAQKQYDLRRRRIGELGLTEHLDDSLPLHLQRKHTVAESVEGFPLPEQWVIEEPS